MKIEDNLPGPAIIKCVGKIADMISISAKDIFGEEDFRLAHS
jgi:uncharacterized protein (DUF1810 family)